MSRLAKEYLKHLSFSTATTLHSDKRKFYRTKVCGLKENTQRLSQLVGKALHDAVAHALVTTDKEQATVGAMITRATEYFHTHKNDAPLDCGDDQEKIDKALSQIEKAIENWEEAIKGIPLSVIDVEQTYEAEVPEFGMKGLGIVDVFGGDAICDWKFVAALGDEDSVKPSYELQAWFYKYILAAQDINIDKAFFVEIPKTKRKDGRTHKLIEIVFEKDSPSHERFKMFLSATLAWLECPVDLFKNDFSALLSMNSSDAKSVQISMLEKLEEKQQAEDTEQEFDYSDV